MPADRVDPKIHDHRARDLVMVGDEMVPDDNAYFSHGDLAVLGLEIDRQVATAKKFPRNAASAEALAKRMVSESEDIALSCIYTLPRGGKLIPGASVRMAEIMAYCWGNSRYGSKIIDEEDEFIVAQGIYFDMERNIANAKTVRRRILDSQGRRYNIDMIQTAGSAAMSIALRNAILQGGIPSPVWMPVYDTAAAVIGGAAKPLKERRRMAIERFEKMGVPAEAVLHRLKLKEVGDIEQEHIVVLRGLAQSIKDEVLTIDQAFPEQRNGRREPRRTDVSEKLRTAAGNGERDKGEEAPAQDADEPSGEVEREPAAAEDGEKESGESAADLIAAAPAALAAAEAAAAEGAAASSATPDIPEEDRDVLDDLRAAIIPESTQAERRRVAKDFAEAMGAMTPAGRAEADRILGIDPSQSATRLL